MVTFTENEIKRWITYIIKVSEKEYKEYPEKYGSLIGHLEATKKFPEFIKLVAHKKLDEVI